MEEIARKILEKFVESDIAEGIAGSAAGGEGEIYVAPALSGLTVALIHRISPGPMVVFVEGNARDFADDTGYFVPGEVFHLPGKGPSGDLFRPYDEAVGKRIGATQALRSGKVVVAGAEVMAEGLPGLPPEPWPITIEPGRDIELQNLLKLLVEGGYRREYIVEGWGRFALRGGVLDIFPSTAVRPVRIELFGDSVESLREFNIVTQRSLDEIRRIELFPAQDPVEPSGREVSSLKYKVVAVNPAGLESRVRELFPGFYDADEAGNLLNSWGNVLRLETLRASSGASLKVPGKAALEFFGNVNAAVDHLAGLAGEGYWVHLVLEGSGQKDRFLEIWDERSAKGSRPQIDVGILSRGFVVPELKMAVYSSADILGRRKKAKRPKKISSAQPVTSYAELEVGGYAVHIDQGIGIFRGLTGRDILGVSREYLLLEYAGGDKLYVPVSQLDRVQRYVGIENPPIHKLRGRLWNKSKRSAKRSAEETARKLFQLYLERSSKSGFAFSQDGTWQTELEDSFQYEDTPDQSLVSLEVKADMELDKPMDRLICGDVGYGKTEVAVRAAMKAVMDSKQVAVLVPTTVLARQHYETFKERMAPFPVKIEMLSRFLSQGEQKHVVSELNKGNVDVLIGTHRILKNDVIFKDLGLLIVDEEQKFGVTHKEKLKRLKSGVDTLAMTATPIPRTLQMSISGIREISIIDTPPEDRHPVSTYIGEQDMDIISKAVKYEVARGGQVFYVHNRIESIERSAGKLKETVPDIAVAVAHGRMDEDYLEKVMLEFADGLYSVLVCTTIIESGLDLPNVNTLIVEGAERLGLAQLYQIRGRVGRAGRRAYAYMFYPRRKALTEAAVARLSTIGEMTELGSGMRVAMRDLEIRGAGNLLGAKQSGHIEAVGFELYCQLLREAVEALKGEAREPVAQATIDVPVDAYIPGDYISDEEARVEEYRRLVVAGRSGNLDGFAEELKDRFGDLPQAVANMLKLEKLKGAAAGAGFRLITWHDGELQIKAEADRIEILKKAASAALREKICEEKGAYLDKSSKTLYLRLAFKENMEKQKMLLMWLELIIDDTINSEYA
ncbi:MAG: transcription-repair coupling factor [Actinobacteria bacterium]|nr:transcription-repair coupling factor [Actinomycetota bacterium]